MQPHYVVGLVSLAIAGFAFWRLFSSQQKTASPTSAPVKAAIANIQQIVGKAPDKQVPPAAPTREEAFQAAFTLIDHAKEIGANDVVKAVSDCLPRLAGGKIESQ